MELTLFNCLGQRCNFHLLRASVERAAPARGTSNESAWTFLHVKQGALEAHALRLAGDESLYTIIYE